MLHYINGKFLKDKDAKISVFDLGFLRGYGIFTFLRTYGTQPFMMNEHLKSLFLRAKLTHLKINLSLKKIKEIIFLLIKKNYQGKDLGFRIILTAGINPHGFFCKKSSFLILVSNIQHYPSRFYQKGIKIKTSKTERKSPYLKTLSSYFNSIQELFLAKKAKMDDVLFVGKKNEILECVNSNFFAVKNGVLITPELTNEIFDGLTKNFVLKLAKENRVPVKERVIYLREIKDFSEAFITSTSREIMPVCQIDLFKLSSPGKITTFLTQLFKKKTEEFRLLANPRS